MPWKECELVEERLRFIARLLEGEKIAAFCRDFWISRVTGCKVYERYKGCGLNGRSRRPAWPVLFLDEDLGFFESKEVRFAPEKLQTMCPIWPLTTTTPGHDRAFSCFPQ